MAVREFNGVIDTGDYIELDNGAIGAICNGAISVTLLLVVKPMALLGIHPLISVSNSGLAQGLASIYYPGSGTLLNWGTDDPDEDVGVTTNVTASEWQVIGVGLPTGVGSNTPRFHRKVLGSGSWTHADATSTVADSSGDASGRVHLSRFPNPTSNNRAPMRLAVVAIWNSLLSDADFETIETAASTAGLMALNPDWAIELNQASVSTTIRDLTTGDGDQVTRVGTTVVTTDDPAWTFSTATTFPTTGILDSFTGSDENPIATNWSGPAFTGNQQLRRLSNQLTADTSGSNNLSSWYDIATVGPNFELYLTLAGISNNNNDYVTLGVLEGPPDGNAYSIEAWYQVGTDFVQIRRDGTVLGATIPRNLSAGDKIGIQRIGSTINAFYYEVAEGVWKLIGTRTDATYSLVGNPFVYTQMTDSGDWLLDDLGGGTLAGAEKQSYYAYRRRAYR